MTATYTATPILKIDGKDASANLLDDILKISVEESLHLPGMFTLMIRNDYYGSRSGENPWMHDNTFAIGKSIEIGFVSSTTEDSSFSSPEKSTLIKGEITAIEAQFNPESQAPIIVRGYDISHRLHRGRYNRSFQNMTDTDIVKKVIGEVGIAAGKIDSTGGPYGFGDPVGYTFQENQTNMEFLRQKAARNGFELFVQDGKLHFRKPVAGDSLSLKWLKDITHFHVRVSSAEQVSAVEVRGWDYQKKEAIVSNKTSQNSQVLTSTQQGKGEASISEFNKNPTMIVVDQPIFSQKESDAIAQSIFNELSGEFVQADAKAEGNPEIRPGKVVKLQDMGKYSGKYYVTETRHLFEARVYTTEFNVRGLREDSLANFISPQARLQPGQTLMIGIVSNNKDPKKWGRVKVKFPTLTDKHESDWARVVSVGAGKNRGFDCLPEVNDEVLVGFEHGDIHRPFVIGGVWNGKDAPPANVDDSVVEGKVRLRTLKTRTGHTLQFVEEDKGDSKKGVYLNTVYGHKLHLNDSDKLIDIKTKDNYQVTLDDQNKKILIKTNKGYICELNDQSQKITLKASSQEIVLKASGQIEINAQQNITLKVGGNKIEISTTNIKLTAGSSSIDLSPAGATLKSSAMTQVEGSMTTIKGNGTVTVSAPMVSIG
ncbi:VgrG-related protein [Calothrix sp. PCC 6303]|uniref:VgrG-related protein n=1 Tax=Calothrix sp. PCC 6303 TaxID=1170562 RepID=UPI0002A05368|nr:VgrG-related protein [Calothrix sp. PCC 6303]AFZ01408.1 Rhs element Vgr protein [Calothrix sp. PCC 6303]